MKLRLDPSIPFHSAQDDAGNIEKYDIDNLGGRKQARPEKTRSKSVPALAIKRPADIDRSHAAKQGKDARVNADFQFAVVENNESKDAREKGQRPAFEPVEEFPPADDAPDHRFAGNRKI